MENQDKRYLKELVEDYWVDNVLEQLVIVLHEKADEWSDLELSDSAKECSFWAEEIEQFLERVRNFKKPL